MPRTIQVGDWIADRFEVFEVHQGGMGLVYIVHDHRAGAGQKVFALKTLREELLGDRERRARFAAECRLWVQLGQHPHIVHAHAVEELEGRPHVLLELVVGGDLQAWIGTARLDTLQAVRFGVQFCLGMEHAIRQGLQCHRDIKPGNLLVGKDGALKITDFGLARIRDELLADAPGDLPDGAIPLVESFGPQPIVWTDPRDGGNPGQILVAMTGKPESAVRPARAEAAQPATAIPANVINTGDVERPSNAPTALTPIATVRPESDNLHLESTVIFARAGTGPPDPTDLRLTRAGLLLGTVPYMAPEQFSDAREVDIRADVYSFGIVFFQMLTGKLPFKGHTVVMLNRQHALYEPPSVVGAIPRRYAREAESLDALVQRCLRKDPAERFSSMGELRQALSRILQRLDPSSKVKR